MKNKTKDNKNPLIGIIEGKGKMGNWFKNFFEKEGLKVIISDKKTKLSNIDLAKRADIVIISVPIMAVVGVIREVRSSIKKNALLSDLTSLKENAVKEMKKAKSGTLGIHPLFGPMMTDINGQTIVFCSGRKSKWIDFLRKIFRKNGAKIIEVSPKEHDIQMAYLQSLLHFSNISLAHFFYAQNFKPKNSFLTPLFRLQSLVFGRILGQNPKVYAEISMENPYFQKILKNYLREISSFEKSITERKYEKFQRKFNESAFHLSDFVKIAEEKTTQILRMIEKQPIKIGRVKKINLKKGKIGYLGPKGTFSFTAVQKIYGNKAKLLPLLTIRDIFEAVLEGKANFGIIPIENSAAGLVSETIQSFIDFPVYALDSFKIPIHHCLLSKEKNIKDIKIIKSHPQALSQCRLFIEKNLSNVVKEPTSSTILPILENSFKNAGFIAPYETKKIFKLNILAENIEDAKDNFTRFFIISRKIEKNILKKSKSEKKNTLLLLSAYNKIGVLRDILDIFAKRKINLVALHSISGYSRAWDYLFFLEIEKSYFSPEIKNILKELEKFCPSIRILGSV